MALQIISAVLFTVFFPGALTLTCYNCNTKVPYGECPKTENCTGANQCSSVTNTTTYNNNGYSIKSCSASCVNWSVNVGWMRYTSQCCSSDFCISTEDTSNGKWCYTCNDTNCSSNKTLNCTGVEDKCFNATDTSNGTIKGCVSKNICENPQYTKNFISNLLCWDANLYNSAQSQAQEAVLLLVPVLPIIFSIRDLFYGGSLSFL